MPVIDLYSYRKLVAEGGTPDVYDYDKFPHELRVQIIHIWRDAIGPYYPYQGREFRKRKENNAAWNFIHNAIAREHGLFDLGKERYVNERCENYFLIEESIDAALDLVEISFLCIEKLLAGIDEYDKENRGIKVSAEDAIAELNERFRRASVGYRFENGRIIRIDSELIHSEVVQPALRFLQKEGFEGPRDEFMKAHGHYRAGETKDAIIDANNAFESTLKAICDIRNWQYPNGARASDLLKLVRENGLLPNYLDNSFDQLAATLKSGLPKLRGEEGAHGQGAKPRETPDYVASYALHLAAAKILFLVE